MSRDAKLGGKGKNARRSPSPTKDPIPRVKEKPSVLTVDEATQGDFRYFCDHPDEDRYIRQFVPGEFGPVELPPVPAGYRYATLVSVTMRVGGEPSARRRRQRPHRIGRQDVRCHRR
jgi:hypothetical protein